MVPECMNGEACTVLFCTLKQMLFIGFGTSGWWKTGPTHLLGDTGKIGV